MHIYLRAFFSEKQGPNCVFLFAHDSHIDSHMFRYLISIDNPYFIFRLYIDVCMCSWKTDFCY